MGRNDPGTDSGPRDRAGPADPPAPASPAEAALLPLLGRLVAEGRPLEATYRRDGWRVRVVVEADAGRPRDESPMLNDMEADVLEAIGAETMTAEKIAEVAGYPNDRGLRSCLASLRRRGLLTGKAGEPGYALTDAGRGLSAGR